MGTFNPLTFEGNLYQAMEGPRGGIAFNPLTREGTLSRSVRENTYPPNFNPHIVGTILSANIISDYAGVLNSRRRGDLHTQFAA